MSYKANILLVDDREENLTALEAILSSLDQNLVRANSGEAALKALLERDFAVILLDVVMPGMDGFETATHIKQREKTKDIPIIFLTAEGIDRHRVFRGYASRFVDYMTKPLDPWLLRAKVEVFLELDRLKRQLHSQTELLRRDLSSSAAGVEMVVAELSALVNELNDTLEEVRERSAGDQRVLDMVQELDAPTQRLTRLVQALRPQR
ncbi:response regulator [Thermobifida fusca]|uniref:Response regulator receiver n=1 Tax=Thermobifida fusca (strain YX) TaxID=269800 RepID=Q47T94_THEFY|nr:MULTISPECIES: response regulator [Thermobifida]AAZ54323.1 response regulator receiver [Thermobifida fusca YX]MBO2529815.1 response regulator [Thermobifida sp.]MDD6792950.1 response regulator [Thermobifida fusca]PPS94072.1 response regulator receiver protein [Thermobifida fusca]PZN62255.1 MAG: response regulator [Thermobifida fusca]